MTRDESTEERTAGCTLQPSLLFFLPLLLFSLEEVGGRGGQILFSLMSFLFGGCNVSV